MAPESPCPVALAWGGCWITAWALGSLKGILQLFLGPMSPCAGVPWEPPASMPPTPLP